LFKNNKKTFSYITSNN